MKTPVKEDVAPQLQETDHEKNIIVFVMDISHCSLLIKKALPALTNDNLVEILKGLITICGNFPIEYDADNQNKIIHLITKVSGNNDLDLISDLSTDVEFNIELLFDENIGNFLDEDEDEEEITPYSNNEFKVEDIDINYNGDICRASVQMDWKRTVF